MYYCFAVSSLVSLPKRSLIPLGDLEAEINAYSPELHRRVESTVTWPILVGHISRRFRIPEMQTREDLKAKNAEALCAMQIPGLEEPRRAVQCPGCKRFFFCGRCGDAGVNSAARQALTAHWKYSCNAYAGADIEFRIQTATRMLSSTAGDSLGGRLIYANDFKRYNSQTWGVTIEQSRLSLPLALITRSIDVPAPYRRPPWFSRKAFRFLERWRIMSFHTGQERARWNCLALVGPPRLHKRNEESKMLGERADLMLSRIYDICMRFLKGACAFLEDPSRLDLRALLLSK